MIRRAPSLAAVEAFLAATRHDSFQAAADEIALSPSAFSRRIQSLEAFAGVPLFDRSAPRLCLTRAGEKFRLEIEPGFRSIARAVNELKRSEQDRNLRLITSSSLALSWLIPRLSQLQRECDLQIDLVIGRGDQHLKSGEIDLAIWGGPQDAPGYPRDPLEDMEAIPAFAASMEHGRHAPCNLTELTQQRLLKARSAPGLWSEWLKKLGCEAEPRRYTEFDTTHLAYESAASGVGVALAVPLLVDRFLREKRLIPCTSLRAPISVSYGLIYANPALRRRSDVRVLLNWLKTEMAQSIQQFNQWTRTPPRESP